MKWLNRKSKDVIIEKDAENEAKTIFINSSIKKWRRMGLLQNNVRHENSGLIS